MAAETDKVETDKAETDRTKVVSIFGGSVAQKIPNQACIEMLETYLELARSGEIIGAVVVALQHDGAANWSCCGMVGGFSLLGAMDVAHDHLRNMTLMDSLED